MSVLSRRIHITVIIIIVILIVVFSIIIVNMLKRDFKKFYRLRSKFHIEIRKVVNLIYNIYKPKILEPYTKVVIKKLTHSEIAEVISKVDEVYKDLDKSNKDNKYIVETYKNMYFLMKERDDLLEDFNRVKKRFPHVIYAKIMNFPEYEYYTERE